MTEGREEQEGVKYNAQYFVDKLRQYYDTRPCTVCGRINYGTLSGFINPVVQDNYGGPQKFGGDITPTIGIYCKVCGNINYHAARVDSLKQDLPNANDTEANEGNKGQ